MERRRVAMAADEKKKKKKEEEEEEESVKDSKAEIVGRICSVSNMFLSCTHRRPSARDSTFVDWYLVLQVGEDASVEEIRKRYLQLALQLHPDKNKHPKADVAFKLVSEAYACLSDKVERKAFDFERCHSFCTQCSRNARHRTTDKNSNGSNNSSSTEKKSKDHHRSQKHGRSHRVRLALREAKRTLEEEARIIDNCLRSHETPSGEEFPLFDPSDYLVIPGYPHGRRDGGGAPKGFRCLRPASFCRREWGESPVYEMRSGGQTTGVKTDRHSRL